jgi:hypothetical protein
MSGDAHIYHDCNFRLMCFSAQCHRSRYSTHIQPDQKLSGHTQECDAAFGVPSGGRATKARQSWTGRASGRGRKIEPTLIPRSVLLSESDTEGPPSPGIPSLPGAPREGLSHISTLPHDATAPSPPKPHASCPFPNYGTDNASNSAWARTVGPSGLPGRVSLQFRGTDAEATHSAGSCADAAEEGFVEGPSNGRNGGGLVKTGNARHLTATDEGAGVPREKEGEGLAATGGERAHPLHTAGRGDEGGLYEALDGGASSGGSEDEADGTKMLRSCTLEELRPLLPFPDDAAVLW